MSLHSARKKDMDRNLPPAARLQAVMFCASIYRGFQGDTMSPAHANPTSTMGRGKRTTSQAVLKYREEAVSFPRSRFKLRRFLLCGRAGSEGLADM